MLRRAVQNNNKAQVLVQCIPSRYGTMLLVSALIVTI